MIQEQKYLHGYNPQEQDRLYAQARLYEQIVYANVDFGTAENILEIGGGVGAQSEILLRRFPNIELTSVEFNKSQITRARDFLSQKSYASGRYQFINADARDLPFDEGKHFDGAFGCFVLEHIPNPGKVLSELRRVLTPGSKIYFTEALNNTLYLEPYCPRTLNYWMKFNDVQYEMGGDPFIGGKLGNLLQAAGFDHIETNPLTMHIDSRNPRLRSKMIEAWSDLIMSGFDNLHRAGKTDSSELPIIRKELKEVAKDPQAVFYYSFVQACAVVPT